MTAETFDDLRALVDRLAAARVVFASLRQGDALFEITLSDPGRDPGRDPAAGAAPAAVHGAGVPERIVMARIVTARGPGIFLRHPPGSTADLPCLAAGGFLFPVCGPLGPEDEVLAGEATLVDYGTPLIRRCAADTEAIAKGVRA